MTASEKKFVWSILRKMCRLTIGSSKRWYTFGVMGWIHKCDVIITETLVDFSWILKNTFWKSYVKAICGK